MAVLTEQSIKTFLETPKSAMRVGYRALRRELELCQAESVYFRGETPDAAYFLEQLKPIEALLESQNIKPTVELAMGCWLARNNDFYDGFGSRQHYGATKHYAAAPLASAKILNAVVTDNDGKVHYPFAHAIKKTITTALDRVFACIDQAPFSLQILFTHNNAEDASKRRLVRHSRVDMCVAILSNFIDKMDWASLTLTKTYIDANNKDARLRGIRTANIEWIEIARLIDGATYYRCVPVYDADGLIIKTTLQEEPTAAFWGAVSWLKNKGVIKSEKVARKVKRHRCVSVVPNLQKSKDSIKALPSIKSIDKTFILSLGVSEESLDKAQQKSYKSRLNSHQSYLERLKQECKSNSEAIGRKINCVVEALKNEAEKIKQALARGEKLFKRVCPHLGIPIVIETRLTRAGLATE